MRIEQNVFGIGSPVVGGDRIPGEALFFALVGNFAERRGEGSQLGFADENGFLPCRCIDAPELAMFAGIVALDEGKFGAVGTPLEAFGSATQKAAIREYGFNGEWLGLSGYGGGKGEDKDDQQTFHLGSGWTC